MKITSVFSLVVLSVALLFASSSAKADTVRCESNGGNYRVCSVDTRGGVRLSRQLSSQGCWQNDTWGYDRNRIWVDRGCRAEFWVGDRNSDSSKNKVVGAVALGLVAAAIIANKNDKRDNNRYDDRYNDGYDDRYDNYGGNPRRTFRCESTNNRFVYCNAPSRGHIEVYKQLSSSNCTYGRSWGSDRDRVWVSNGCRAEFAVY